MLDNYIGGVMNSVLTSNAVDSGLNPDRIKQKTMQTRLFRIMSIPNIFRLFRVMTSEMLGRQLPVFTRLLGQRQHIIVVDAVDYK